MTRAEVEKELNEKYKIEVRILDRSWIVTRVFEHDRVRLAVETLNLTGYDEMSHKLVGPKDTERETELNELEQQIEDIDRYQGVKYQLAEDCLRAALLARGLERSRVEVDGRFDRTERVAEQVNDRQQRLRIVYARAWTAIWWYDDFEELNRLYDQVETLASGSMQTTDIMDIANLWSVLHTTVGRGQLDPKSTKLNERTLKLKAELTRLAADKERPNNAGHAEIHLLLMDLHEVVARGKSPDVILSNIKNVLAECEGLLEFPMEPIIRILLELGEFFADNVTYDNLFEMAVALTERRTSEGEAGRVLMNEVFKNSRPGRGMTRSGCLVEPNRRWQKKSISGSG